ncbi:hypothetical protein Ga0123462_1637 [Mariprofundus ferrinatatus]|uniref:Uncharacterized protein n=1 Tax=Mariprofundus ferrinatatus TaxID=1921087 RepID=A0A2K8L5A0_9PROT|nr:hypothetical protein [Mariprofundus ferrinatatus]ATX82495.1 hypothetical protein Ga0123462_1637 [Mariprofundus ferrinatatus]
MQAIPKLTPFPQSFAVQKAKPAALKEHSAAQLTPAMAPAKPAGAGEPAKFGLLDFIDMINPLQHLPVISTIYRKLTGDEIGDEARIVGGAIFGGLLGSWITGVASAVANVFVSHSTGKDIGDHVMEAADAPSRVHSQGVNTAADSQFSHSFAETAEARVESAETAMPKQPLPASHAVKGGRGASHDMIVGRYSGSETLAPQEKHGEMLFAINLYREQMDIDDFRKDVHFWV